MDCVVITRFNLKVKFKCSQKDNNISATPWLDSTWLSVRFDLFEKYIFRAFSEQTDKNFTWLVLFHQNTPEEFRKRIEDYRKQLPSFTPVFLSDEDCDNFRGYVHDYICSHYRENILTIRMDSDDYVSQSYIEAMKSVATAHNNSGSNSGSSSATSELIGSVSERTGTSAKYISFTNGLQYDVPTKTILTYHYVKNHFIGMICDPAGPCNHVYMSDHTSITEKDMILIEDKKYLWVEICSDYNFHNSVSYRPRSVFVPFSVLKQYPAIELRWHSRPTRMLCICRDFVKAVVKKIIQ